MASGSPRRSEPSKLVVSEVAKTGAVTASERVLWRGPSPLAVKGQLAAGVESAACPEEISLMTYNPQ